MLNSLLFGSYCGCLGVMALNAAKQRNLDEYETDLKEFREYDFSHEAIKMDHFKKNKPLNCIILAQYNNRKKIEDGANKAKEPVAEEPAEDRVLF